MKLNRTLGIGVALALALVGLSMVLSLLPARAEAGPAAGTDRGLPAPESLSLPLALDVVATNTLSIVPASTAASVGEVFTVNVVISDAQDLGAVEYTLTFFRSVVLGARVRLGDFPGSTGRTIVELPASGSPISNAIGTIEHGFVSFVGVGNGPNGAGIIASIAFTATGAGTSPLNLTEAQVIDTYGHVMTPTILMDGSAVVSEAAQFPVYLPLVLRNY